MTLLIEACDLRRSFGPTLAVDAVSLQVQSGEIYGLVGPDGAGKTTTIRMLCGALRPHKGEVRLGGIDLLRHTEEARGLIGYLPQRFSLYEELTTMENLRFFAEVRGLPASEWLPRSESVLEFVGLREFSHRRAGHLSGGMKQKLGLAAALVHRPRILLLDEPTTGVDPVTRREFWKLIINLLAREEVAILISTPYMDEAARCNRVGFMQNARLVLEGEPADLMKQLEGRILELRGSPLRTLRRVAEAEAEVEAAQVFGDRLHLRVSPGKPEGFTDQLRDRLSVSGVEIASIGWVPPTLEDVFIYLTYLKETSP